MVRRVSQPPFLAQPGGRQQVGIVATVCENAEPRYQNPAQEKELPARNQIGQWNEWGERPKECIPGRHIDTLNNESPGILWDMTTSSVQFDIIIQEDYNQCHTKSSYQTWRSDQRPAPAHLCLLYCACHAKCIFADPLQMSHPKFWNCCKPVTFLRCTIPCACHAKRHLNVQKCSATFFFTFDFEMCFTQSQVSKVVRDRQFFTLVPSKLSFAPRRRALFPHHNFQKRSGVGVLCMCLLRNVLRATTACNCSSLIWPDCSAPAALI